MTGEISEELDQHLVSLKNHGRRQLRERWRELFRAAPPIAFTPDILVRGIAWRLQERAMGGLSASARLLVVKAGQAPASRPKRTSSLRLGNRLVRRWRGRTYVVDVTADGLVHDGAKFGSLTEIARHITGTRWSGPRFFGLTQ